MKFEIELTENGYIIIDEEGKKYCIIGATQLGRFLMAQARGDATDRDEERVLAAFNRKVKKK